MADGGTLPSAWRATAFEQLADHSLDGVWACDGELRCLYWNATLERLTGLPAAGVLGHGIIDVLARVGPAGDGAAIRRALDGADSVVFEQRAVVTPGR